jgi:GT2 family glycosyltransferase
MRRLIFCLFFYHPGREGEIMLAIRLKAICHRLIQSIGEDGYKSTYIRIRRKLHSKYGAKTFKRSWRLDEADRRQQVNRVFSSNAIISILVPLYNTPVLYLHELLDSVQTQTYKNLELCLADGSDETHAEVGEIVKKRSESDKRIRYLKLTNNGGISENTNACMRMAKGAYFALLDHDDLLHPSALYYVMEAIEQTKADFIYTDEATCKKHPRDAFLPHFKQDFSPDTLRAHNYICHLTVFSRELAELAGGFRKEYDGSQDYDMVLRLTEKAKKIVHIPRILYYWRNHQASVASNVAAKPYVINAAKAAIDSHLHRIGLCGKVMDTVIPSIYRISYALDEEALVSIIIPTCDHAEQLRRCIDSILKKTEYRPYEIIIVENNSKEQCTFDYYETLKNDSRIKVLRWQKPFNYSAINNFASAHATGKYLLFLNNDVEIISPGWMAEMMMFAQRPDVGAAGAKLYYPDGRVQHAGIGIGLLTLAGHYHRGCPHNDYGYMGRLQYQQNVSAVTGACLLLRAQLYRELGGMEEALAVNFNDVDLCLRIREKGLLIVFTPFSELVHYESLSRGMDVSPEKRKRYLQEVAFMRSRWTKQLEAGDPYFSPNFDPLREDFSFR